MTTSADALEAPSWRRAAWSEPCYGMSQTFMESNQDNQAVAIPLSAVICVTRTSKHPSAAAGALRTRPGQLQGPVYPSTHRRRIRALGYATLLLTWNGCGPTPGRPKPSSPPCRSMSPVFPQPLDLPHTGRTYLPELIERACRSGGAKTDFVECRCAGGEEAYSLALLLADLPGRCCNAGPGHRYQPGSPGACPARGVRRRAPGRSPLRGAPALVSGQWKPVPAR